VYFHSTCFDGIVSAAMASDFLEEREGWTVNEVVPVNYDLRSGWLSCDLLTPCAIVDFLYHPQATFWADHHSTTFLDESVKIDFERRRGPWIVYNDRLGSCALLLRRHFADCFGFKDPRYDEMVEWADKIDSARYASVEEAVLGDAPALQIRASLAAGSGRELSKQLVKSLRTSTLDQVARLPIVRERAEEVQTKIAAGLERFAQAAEVHDGEIVVFDVTTQKNDMISRYAPYYFFPEARYSVGVVRSPKSAKITAMRNPWREFPSVHLGKIFEGFGGGGHQRVGAVILAGMRAQEAGSILAEITRRIREQDGLTEGAHAAKV
jgi:hypothetical protein